jgi:hypothetical protein
MLKVLSVMGAVVAAKIGGAPERGAGAPPAGMRPCRGSFVPCNRCTECPAPGSHPSKERLEPAPPCTGRIVTRLANIPDIRCTGRLAITNFGSQRTRVSLC